MKIKSIIKTTKCIYAVSDDVDTIFNKMNEPYFFADTLFSKGEKSDLPCFSGRTVFNLEIDANITESVDIINLTNMPIKRSTIKQLKEDQQKHGYKELTTMVADVLEKHYEQD